MLCTLELQMQTVSLNQEEKIILNRKKLKFGDTVDEIFA